jgi:hypothetical protein
LGKFVNTLELDCQVPYKAPGDVEGKKARLFYSIKIIKLLFIKRVTLLSKKAVL